MMHGYYTAPTRKLFCAIERSYKSGIIDIALDEMHSSAVLSLIAFFCDVAVGVGEIDERGQSVLAHTAPQLRYISGIYLPCY